MHRSLIKTRFPLDLYRSMKGEPAFHPFRPFRSPAGIQRGYEGTLVAPDVYALAMTFMRIVRIDWCRFLHNLPDALYRE